MAEISRTLRSRPLLLPAAESTLANDSGGHMRLLLIALLFCLLATPVAATEKPLVEVPLGDAPSRGPSNAPVTMVEFIDFQ